MENNAILKLCEGKSQKTQSIYYYLSVLIDNKEISRIFIKETEVLYYKSLLKEV